MSAPAPTRERTTSWVAISTAPEIIHNYFSILSNEGNYELSRIDTELRYAPGL